MTEVQTYLKPEPIRCQDVCGETKCEQVGQPTKKGHVRGCCCRSCRGRKANRNGHSKQNRGARALGLVTSKFAPSDEENLGGPLRFEHKSGANDAGPVRTRYEACRAQSEAAKSIGDPRPFVAGFTPPGSRQMYVVVRSDDLELVVAALGAAWGFFDG
jgi:hypothetical protein